jgi:predicted RNA-binding protein (virulence factor B family)
MGRRESRGRCVVVTILQTGETVTLEVSRKAPFGYFLTNGTKDVLLHYSELVGEISEGDSVDVFLYTDAEERLSATMRKPLIQYGELARLEVADIHEKLGAFLEMGLGRQLLLPRSDLPEDRMIWPQIGDFVFVTLKRDKQGRMIASLADERVLTPMSQSAPADMRNKQVQGWVYNVLSIGAFVYTEDLYIGFIHRSEMTRDLRLGEYVDARVAFVREDGNINLSMRPVKEKGREEDADRILTYLQEQDGSMPYWDKTDPEIIKQKFGISKAAFKRAIGKLIKDGVVYQQEGWTRLEQKRP